MKRRLYVPSLPLLRVKTVDKTYEHYCQLCRNQLLKEKRFEAVDDLIERCAAISSKVANTSKGVTRSAA